jgi:zinc transport system substrate-binding protein
MVKYFSITGAIFCLLCSVSQAVDSPRVVASIKPIHSLVVQVMDGIGEPVLLMKGATSPHNYALKPSEARALNIADAIFWIGGEFESFLRKPVAGLKQKTHTVAFSRAKSVRLIKGQDDHGHAASGHNDDHAAIDMHLWLDPENAKAMLAVIAKTLGEIDPTNSVRYTANAINATKQITKVTTEIEEALEPIKKTPFIVFHDAYQYFEKRFRIYATDAISVNPERQPGAKRLYEIRRRIKSSAAECVFSEPQFAPKLIETVIEGTSARTGILDPLGASIPAGPDAYANILKGIAAGFLECLGGGS